MAANWTYQDFQEGNPRWTAGNGNEVSVIPARLNGMDAAFLVLEQFTSGSPSDNWLDEVRYMYADICDDDEVDKYLNDKAYLYKHQMIVWGKNDSRR